jgi:hypothetical protein
MEDYTDNRGLTTTVCHKGEKYHIFLKLRIYNLLSLSITFVDDDKQDIRKTIFELFEKYNFNFKKLNYELNGDYALVIGKEVAGKLTEIWMSTDHIANVKLYYRVQGPGYLTNGPGVIKFSLKPFEKSFEMPGGCMLNLRLDDEGNIKEEIFMEYEEECNPVLGAGNSSDIIRDISSAYVLIGFALDCIIEKRLKHTKKVYKGESREDKYIMKVARVFNEDIEEVEEKGKKVISGNYEGEEGIYPFHDKTFLRLMSRVDESIREELYKRLFI